MRPRKIITKASQKLSAHSLAVIFLLIFTKPGNAQIIVTIAGHDSTAYSGDGGPATAAGLYNPAYSVVDSAGNVYIADVLHHRIRKVTPAGIISTIGGTGVYGYTGNNGPAIAAHI